jgi:serine-aspartate repeat-containing protein C/D/E
VGLLQAIRNVLSRSDGLGLLAANPQSEVRNPKSAIRGSRRCHIEPLESRRLMAGDGLAPQVLLGSVYFEEATGDDSQRDIIEVSFVGGAPGTTLNRLTINGDKQQNGLTEGDVFFDTAAGGLGAFQHGSLSVASANGFTINSVTVVDGGSQIVFDLSGFDAGEKLVLSVDADEAQYVDGTDVDSNSLVEGAEFQRSILAGQFAAPGYVDLTLTGTYWDAFDDEFDMASAATGLSLGLPNDRYSATHDFTDRTAGAVAYAAQVPLATLAGWVYHDHSDDGVFDHGAEQGIGGVSLELIDSNGTPTGITTTTSSHPDTLGFYEFRDLYPGTYGVREVQPGGWLDGKDTAGSHGGAAADEAAGRVDRIFGAILNFGDHAVNYNFGELLAGSIAGRVHAHHGPDCNFNDPEILLAGVRIDLLDANGNFIRSTLTNANGQYSFTGLAPAFYQVREHQPTQYYDGGERIGTAGGAKRDVPGVYSIFTGINIKSGLDAIQYDFCERVGMTLTGNVYHDRDNDGTYDRGAEEGIGGVVVKLLDSMGTDTAQRATTNSAGYYEFTNLAAGTYAVMEVHPAGWLDGIDTPGNLGGIAEVSPPGDMISQIAINWGQTALEYNFGELLPGSIAGRVHAHSGEDCNFDDPEILLEGVRIDLLDATGNVAATTTTNATGEYSFTGLRPGTYTVREHQPAGYFDGGERIGTSGGAKHDVPGAYSVFTGINIASDFRATQYDFCEKLPASISGRVHLDLNEDQDFDDPDLFLAGVVIELLDDDGNLVATTTTNAAGEYRFEGLAPGEYRVHEIQPGGYFDSIERVGTAGGALDGLDTILSIYLPPGMNATQYDFSERVGVTLSGNVYHDRDNDAAFDRGTEEGIGGVVVKLLNGSGADTGLRATTSAAGFYQFTNLAAGAYAVVEVHPAGWLDGIDTPGNLGGVADVSPPGDRISQIVINWGQAGTEYNFGELLPGSIHGIVVVSTDPECEPRDGEPPIAGVRIDLLDAVGNVVATTTTNAAGEYSFTDLRPGTYSVREHQPAGYFDADAHVGTGGGTRLNSNLLGDIDIASGTDLFEYDFCEEPPSTISGYVFIDGPPIVTDELPTPEEIAALRGGLRTSDDRPLAGVVLELRQGASGDPIFVDQALPGHYAGGPNDIIRVITDTNGFYHFTGLRAGTYAVVEVGPEGVIDGIDTPGTLGGLPVNPRAATDHPAQPHAIPTPGQQATIELFRRQFGNDAIVRIPLPAGRHSLENNFSEVTTQPPIPPLIPPEDPPPRMRPPVFPSLAVPFVPKLVLPPRPPLITPPDIFGGSSQAIGFTWHLSVLNAGWPRSATPAAVRFQMASTQLDSAAWQNTKLDQAGWTLATLEENAVNVLRQEVFGTNDATPIVGDFNGDGVCDVGVFLDGQWFLDLNGNGRWDAGDLWAHLGSEGDLPVTGDWDADGKADIGIYGPAWPRDPWAIAREPGLPDLDNFPVAPAGKMKNVPPTTDDTTSGARVLKRTAGGSSRADAIDHVFNYGTPGDAPVTGDWNGDGIRQIGVFRDGQWNLDLNGDGRFTEADAAATFGEPGDLPVAGDFDGNGFDEIGVYRAGTWIIDTNRNRELDAQDKVFELGGANDKPVVGDWNDDGIDDPGVYQPAAAGDRLTRRAG